MIGICTDSNSQLPEELRERFGIVVVPLTIELDDHEYLEGVDLDADGFYTHFRDGRRPNVTTSQPSPGQFALAYEELAERGCTAVLSVHVGANFSGTLNAARLAAHSSSIPVRLVDTGLSSFGISCCAWVAADVLAGGGGIDQAAAAAESLAPHIGNVFTVSSFELVSAASRAGGSGADGHPGVPVLTLRSGHVEPVGLAGGLAEAVETMASAVLADGGRVNVAVGLADRAGSPLADALAERLSGDASVAQIVRYRIGPSVGAHTGPGTAGVFWFPAPDVGDSAG